MSVSTEQYYSNVLNPKSKLEDSTELNTETPNPKITKLRISPQFPETKSQEYIYLVSDFPTRDVLAERFDGSRTLETNVRA